MASGVWIFAEHRDGVLRKVSFELVGKGRDFALSKGASLTALLFGHGVEGLAPQLIQAGADTVLVADHEGLREYTTEAYTKVLADLVVERRPEIMLFPATSLGKDLSARAAARLKVGLATDCTELHLEDGRLSAVRPIYAGRAYVRVTFSDDCPQMASVRPNVFPPARLSTLSGPGQGEIVKISAEVGQVRARVKEVIRAKSETVELTEADIVVSGGRGLKGPENFPLIEELAKTLGAAVGASRAVVDAGWRPHSEQVGQTGKVVTPTLYVACGISGAAQHIAGMGSSKYIVAINKDPEAPIFKLADFGIVGDVFQILPVLTEELRVIREPS